MEKLIRILSDLRPDVDFQLNHKLIEDHVLDSFDIVALVGEINEVFNISIGVDDLVPKNFNSIDTMMKLIERLQNQG